jgi:hypothetical protein
MMQVQCTLMLFGSCFYVAACVEHAGAALSLIIQKNLGVAFGTVKSGRGFVAARLSCLCISSVCLLLGAVGVGMSPARCGCWVVCFSVWLCLCVLHAASHPTTPASLQVVQSRKVNSLRSEHGVCGVCMCLHPVQHSKLADFLGCLCCTCGAVEPQLSALRCDSSAVAPVNNG